MATPTRNSADRPQPQPIFDLDSIPAGAKLTARSRVGNIEIRDYALIYLPRRAPMFRRLVVLAGDRMKQLAIALTAAAARIWPAEWPLLLIERISPEYISINVPPIFVSLELPANRRVARRVQRRMARTIGQLIEKRDAWLDALAMHPPQSGLRLLVQKTPFGQLHMAIDADGEPVATGNTLDMLMHRLAQHFERGANSALEPRAMIVDLRDWLHADDETGAEFARRLHDRHHDRHHAPQAANNGAVAGDAAGDHTSAGDDFGAADHSADADDFGEVEYSGDGDDSGDANGSDDGNDFEIFF